MDMNLTIEESAWDVAVIGGGPSGMMAAGRAAERGAKVILIEKNENLGKKLLISGGGRCNLTNAEFDTRKFLEKFKDSNKFLFSTFSKWNVKDTLDFFNSRKMETRVEAFQRVFPITDKSQSVLNVLVEYMKQGNVTVISNTEVSGFEVDNKKITAVKTKNDQNIYAKQFILATGGTSHPETGSTGDGFKWLQKIGHEIIEPSAALVPIALKDEWIKDLQGITLEKTKISIFQNNVKQASRIGKILFTHFGVSGPAILNMSQEVGELLKYGDVVISLDILPELDYGQLNLKLQEIFKEHSNKNFKNSLATLIPSS
ncbi:MAG: aminoacetone oxidase family FAD-binding enzyme, partial [bacterium]